MLSVEQLIAFETRVADIYEQGHIKAPIHLRNGLESQLIDIFHQIGREDYVFTTWGSHLHAMLKGVPEELILEEILRGNSITLHFPQYKFHTSAIVGGVAPIAVGTAMGIKLRNDKNCVYVFLGDMASLTGIVHECIIYSHNQQLPIRWIIEDNEKSVCTPTDEAWNQPQICQKNIDMLKSYGVNNVHYFKYQLTWPHSGTGKFVSF